MPISNNATGFTPASSSTSIHGLGPEATLVLINGHRVANYPIGQRDQVAFVDLNCIPLSAIDRIEVLTNGTSAIYGADAVAGFVNIIFRKNFDGAEMSVRYGNTTSEDSHEVVANLVQGVASANGNITVGLSYYSRAAIFQRDRFYSAIPPYLNTNAILINAQITTAAIRCITSSAGTLKIRRSLLGRSTCSIALRRSRPVVSRTRSATRASCMIPRVGSSTCSSARNSRASGNSILGSCQAPPTHRRRYLPSEVRGQRFRSVRFARPWVAAASQLELRGAKKRRPGDCRFLTKGNETVGAVS